MSELLRRLDSVLPASITGGLPGRSTTDVYWPLQLKVEQSLLEDGEGTRYGYVLDFPKTLTGLLLGTHSSVEQRKHWQSASQLLCPLCKLGEDTVTHTVIHCPELATEREKWAGVLDVTVWVS